MALLVIGLGVSVAMFFQVFIHEDTSACPPKPKWFAQPQFYLVSTVSFVCPIPEQPTPLVGDCNTILHMLKSTRDHNGSDNLPACSFRKYCQVE